MRQLYIYSILILSITSLSGQGIDFFHGDWQEALKMAQEQEKIIFVDAYAKWCGPCKKMAATTFKEETIGEYFNKNFISMKIDMEEPMGREFGSKYPVSAYPTLFFIDAQGEIVTKSTGFKDVSGLISLGKSVASKADFSGKYKELYDNGTRDYDTVIKYIAALNKAKKPSLKIANEYLASEHKINTNQYLDFLFEAMTEADSKVFDLFMDNIDALSKKQGTEAINERLLAAANATTAKAIKFEYPELINETSEKLKSYDKSLATRYQTKADIQYAAAYKDEKTFAAKANKYLKQYGKKDIEANTFVAKQVKKHFADSADMNALEVSCLRKVIDIEPSEKHYLNLIQVYMEKKDYKTAHSIASEGVEKLAKADIKTTQLSRLVDSLARHI